MTRSFAAAAVLVSVMSMPAAAEERATASPASTATPRATTDIGTVSPNILWTEGTLNQRRPMILPALYASYVALQAYDVYSTRSAMALGAREANPVMQPVVRNTGAVIALKAGVGVATIAAAERLWRTNKPAAIAVMVAGNSVAAMVAARNARTLSQLR